MRNDKKKSPRVTAPGILAAGILAALLVAGSVLLPGTGALAQAAPDTDALAAITAAAATDGAANDAAGEVAYQEGMRALNKGNLETAARLLREAADQPSSKNYVLFAQFHLARLYGTPGNRYSNRALAFELFNRIATAHANVDPQLDWRNVFVGRAEFELARFLKVGIPEMDLAPDPAAARDHLVRAAQIFADPDAQLELAKLDLEADETRRAGLDLLSTVAEQRGHSESLAYLSELYSTGQYVGRTEKPTAYAYALLAVENARGHERPYIESIFQSVFCRTTLADREQGLKLLPELRALNEERNKGKPPRNAEIDSITAGVTWRCSDGAVVASPSQPSAGQEDTVAAADDADDETDGYRPAGGDDGLSLQPGTAGMTLEYHVPGDSGSDD